MIVFYIKGGPYTAGIRIKYNIYIIYYHDNLLLIYPTHP